MFKSLLICFAVLFAQLAALNYIDNRLNGGSTEVRQTVSSPSSAQREEDKEEESKKNNIV
ncbi:hypothetical protein QPM17_22935 [Marinobacter sp. TBZ242]|uniref:Uncharacterized protein n=1 Tax=Marinobacter azerbaijanicus TaxID=3050455 RepID=A0ABT7IIM4_9GAMM|nr:hypothetical protein [Marinobacter sp. TBZ242]MDL0434001.1 hypothetical protein [Marinobacter sp. TBZ242]